MAKETLKRQILTEQDHACALTGVEFAEDVDLSLLDTDRLRMKMHGGTYVEPDNTRVVEPRAHMERHGILRVATNPGTVPDTPLARLKATFDDRVQVMRLSLKINNQLLAYQRRVDSIHPATEQFLQEQLKPIDARLAATDREIARQLKGFDDPLVKSALGVPGMGPITVAALTVYVDLEKAACPSALWKYAGLDVASHERYKKGTLGGGNKTLRTVLWNTANSMMKNKKCLYREVYDRVKLRLSQSEKPVFTRNTAGLLVEQAWKDTKPSHRHGAALRAIMKHVLADYWLVGRTLKGLRTTPLYAEAVLGHTHIIAPRERGWKY